MIDPVSPLTPNYAQKSEWSASTQISSIADEARDDIFSVDSFVSESLSRAAVSFESKKQVQKKGICYTILGKGAAKTALAREDLTEKVYLVANSRFRIKELSTEVAKTKVMQKNIASRVGECLDPKAEVARRQSNLAIDLEEIPVSELGEYAISSSRASESLETFLQKKELSHSDRYNICSQVAKAVQQLHDAGFIHGDLKPDNFLIFKDKSGEYVVKLSDFGQSREASAGDSFRYWGNPRYISPENRASMAGEVYAVGLICIRILEEPFLGEKTSLIEPQRTSLVQASEKRRGIERYLVNNAATVQVENKSVPGKMLRVFRVFFPQVDAVGAQKEVLEYRNALVVEFENKIRAASSELEQKDLINSLLFLSKLGQVLNSDPAQRGSLSELISS